MSNRPKVARRRQARVTAPERILDMNELARAEPVRATRTPPSRLLRELDRAQRIPVQAEAMQVAPRVASRATRRSSQGGGYRPPWADLDYLPLTRPHRFKSPVIDHYAARGYPFELGMQTLMQESLTFSWPWRTIGKIFSGPATDFSAISGSGTGVMLGPNLMMTASHVAPWNGGWMRFIPAYRDGAVDPRFGSSYVSRFRGIRPQGGPNGYDYVICRLATPIGNNTGWMGWQVWASEAPYYSGTWFMNGFPGTFQNGQRLAVEFPIKIDDVDDDDPGRELEFGFYPVGGWSGGPFWGYVNGDPRLVGIASGWEYDVFDPLRTVIASGWLMGELIQYGWANWV